jgi:hypothetical protein
MKNIKKVITAAALMMVLMVGTSFGGVLVQGISSENPEPCTAQTSKGGVVLMDIVGILVQGLTGVLVQGVRTEAPVECGVLVQG